MWGRGISCGLAPPLLYSQLGTYDDKENGQNPMVNTASACINLLMLITEGYVS